MERFKKICRALLFPHIAIMAVLVPISAAFLIYSMAVLGTETVPAYISYVLAAYTLTVWCIKLPAAVRFFRGFKNENKYALMWFGDIRLRTSLTLYGSLVWNASYAALQLGLAFKHSSFWFGSLAVYYFCLALMRVFLATYTRRHAPGDRMRTELKKYRACGWVLLFMNLALALMIFFMVYWGRTFRHGMITTIAMAAYTFASFTFATVNTVRYRKLGSPVYAAAKAISLAAACVSMITLTSTMLTTFGGTDGPLFRRLMLSLIGGAVSAFVIGMAVYMIVKGRKKLKMSEVKDEQ